MDPLITGLGPHAVQPTQPSTGAGAAKGPDGGEGFGDQLQSAVGSVETQHQAADDALKLLATGEEVDLHGAMIELEKADVALRTMVSVRNRVIGAYEQIMNMGV